MSASTGWPRRLISLACTIAFFGGLLWYIGSLPDDPVLAGLVALLGFGTIAVIVWSLKDYGGQLHQRVWHVSARQEAVAPAAMDYRLIRLRRDLRDATESREHPDRIHPLLVQLAGARLRERHGIDLDTEPERARAAVPDELWHYLSHPPEGTGRRSRADIRTAITNVEEI